MNYTKLLEGKYAVITGGAHGMGHTMARLFAQHGATVAVCGYSDHGYESVKYLQSLSPDSFFFKCNMEHPEEVEAFGQEALRRFPKVDIQVNTVGISRGGRCWQIPMEEWDEIQTVNLRSMLILQKLFFPVMMENGGGSFIHISTIHSHQPGGGAGCYAASKGGMNALSRVMAQEGGRYGIRSNVVSPAWVATSQIFDSLLMLDNDEKALIDYLEDYEAWEGSFCPAWARDVANCVLFLASDMGAYITGHNIDCTGGVWNQAHYTDFPYPEDYDELRAAYFRSMLRANDLGRAPRGAKALKPDEIVPPEQQGKNRRPKAQ